MCLCLYKPSYQQQSPSPYCFLVNKQDLRRDLVIIYRLSTTNTCLEKTLTNDTLSALSLPPEGNKKKVKRKVTSFRIYFHSIIDSIVDFDIENV